MCLCVCVCILGLEPVISSEELKCMPAGRDKVFFSHVRVVCEQSPH